MFTGAHSVDVNFRYAFDVVAGVVWPGPVVPGCVDVAEVEDVPAPAEVEDALTDGSAVPAITSSVSCVGSSGMGWRVA